MAKEDGADRAGDAEATAVEEGGRKDDVEDASGGIPEKVAEKVHEVVGSAGEAVAEATLAPSSIQGDDLTERVNKMHHEASDSVLRGWIAILYSLIFCYTAGVNLWTGPSNVSGNAGDTIVCKAAQIVMLPLYKPTALSMWSAFMPLVQLAYWAYVRTKIKKMEEEKERGSRGTL